VPRGIAEAMAPPSVDHPAGLPGERPAPGPCGGGSASGLGPASRVTVAVGLDAAAEVLSRTYGPVRITARGQRRGIRLEQATLGPVQLHDVALGMEYDAVGNGPRSLVFGEVTSGRFRQTSEGGDRYYQPGDLFFAGQPGHAYTATVHDVSLRVAVIDPALTAQVAATAPGRPPAPVRFTGHRAVSPQAASQWTATVAYLRGLLASPQAADAPLVTASAARLLAAVTLGAFPNDAVTDPTTQDRHDGSTATLRRAVAFIDEHAHEDIALADVAAAARVTIRAVQLAFRRHLNTTPTSYLRQVRLDHAHRELQSADPDRDSVTAVSYRWGFASPSRFAAYYRGAYGVAPSRTLHG
jgi:AraC-like DNA-binding protein